MTRRLRVAVAASAALLMAGCSGPSPPPPPAPPTVNVATNVYALQWVIERVGGEHVTVERLESVAHSGEEVPEGDRSILGRADRVLYVGTMSPAVSELLGPDADPERVRDVARLPGIDLLPADPELRDDQLSDGTDPHLWLDPGRRMEVVVNAVQRALVTATEGPEFTARSIDFAGYFFGTAQQLKADLDRLHGLLDARLLPCGNRAIVAEHPAFGYFAQTYGLQQIAITKPSGGGLEPDVDERQRQALRDYWTTSGGRRTIFLDPARSGVQPAPEREYVDDLANELDAQYLYLDTMEDDPRPGSDRAPRDYLRVMEDNMLRVREGLGCE